MDGDAPEGGKWNYDAENRKPAPDEVSYSGPMHFTPDEITEDVLSLVEKRFSKNYGSLRPFCSPSNRDRRSARSPTG